MTEFNVDELIAGIDAEAKKALTGKRTENTPFPVILKPGVISFYQLILDSEASDIARENLFGKTKAKKEHEEKREDILDVLKGKFTLPDRITQEPRLIDLSSRDLQALDAVYDAFIKNLASSGPGQFIMQDNKQSLHRQFGKAVRESKYSIAQKMKTKVSGLFKRKA